MEHTLNPTSSKPNFNQTFRRCLYLCSLVVMLFDNTNVVHAQPVEQDFDGISFVKVSSGEFIFGTPPTSNYWTATEKQSPMALGQSFWISKYEISQAQWFAIMGSNPSTFPALPGDEANTPVETISWYDAQAFISALNQQAGANHYRLPTEAEWEYVAKAGHVTTWPFGDLLDQLDIYAHRNVAPQPQFLGLKQANSWGIHDLYGNVYEWCQDWYVANRPLINGPCPPDNGTYKVIRGGSNACADTYLRSASRQFAKPERKGFYIGLRLVRVDNPSQDPFQVGAVCAPLPVCGDGVLNPGEECDDGNLESGDNCSIQCVSELVSLINPNGIIPVAQDDTFQVNVDQSLFVGGQIASYQSVGGTYSADSLGEATVVQINGVEIPASTSLDDTVSQYSSKNIAIMEGTSSIAKAAAINKVAAQSNVYAKAGVSRTDNSDWLNLLLADSMGNFNGIVDPDEIIFGNTGSVQAFSLDETFYMEINGQIVTGLAVLENDADGSLRSAINQLSSVTGVYAELNDQNELVLIAPDGRDISIAYHDISSGEILEEFVGLKSGLDGALAYSAPLMLVSPDPFTIFSDDISGTNASLGGLISADIFVSDALVNFPLNELSDEHIGNNDTPQQDVEFILVSNVSHGQLTFNSDGSFVYEPFPGYAGDDSFVYKIKNVEGNEDLATVNILVGDVDLPCQAQTEVCDGLDNDCDGQSDEGFGANCTVVACSEEFFRLGAPIPPRDPSLALPHGQNGVDYTISSTSNGLVFSSGAVINVPPEPKGHQVVAARGGVVVEVVNDFNASDWGCNVGGNKVVIEHDNGYRTSYELLEHTLTVEGQAVQSGEQIGSLGVHNCGGYSSPRFTFKVYDCDGNVVDPMAHNLWSDETLELNQANMMAPILSPTHLSTSQLRFLEDFYLNTIYVPMYENKTALDYGVVLSYAEAGDQVQIKIYDPAGTLYYTKDFTVNNDYVLSHWHWQFNSLPNRPGKWMVEYRFRNELEYTQFFDMACAQGYNVDTCDQLDNDCDGLVDEEYPLGCSCNMGDLSLQWPMSGQSSQDWVVTNYVDLDVSGGMRDYQNGTKTYNGHTGTDISVASFREMDGPDFAYVRAAAEGMIVAIIDEHPDRHVSCVDHNNNTIIIEHANGFKTRYLHNKQFSSLVMLGQRVLAGEVIAIVGSSGCSTGPHIHFEVRDCDDNLIDPFESNLWASPPAYDAPFGIMDLFLKDGSFSGVNELKDPPADVIDLVGNTLGVGIVAAGGDANSSFTVRIFRPNGSEYTSQTKQYNQLYRKAYWRYSWTIPNTEGQWRVNIEHQGTVMASKVFWRGGVNCSPDPELCDNQDNDCDGRVDEDYDHICSNLVACDDQGFSLGAPIPPANPDSSETHGVNGVDFSVVSFYPNPIVFSRGVLINADPGTEAIGNKVVAARSGTVVEVVNQYNSLDWGCNAEGNKVVIEHTNGYRTSYKYLESVHVGVGQTVQDGEQIGTLTLTGCTAGQAPGFAFQLVDCNGLEIDPMANDLWSDPNFRLYQANMIAPIIAPRPLEPSELTQVDNYFSNPNEPPIFNNQTHLDYGVWLAYAKANDPVGIKIIDPTGDVYYDHAFSVPSDYILSRWYWRFSILPNQPGKWKLEYRFRGELKYTQYFIMDCSANPGADICNQIDDDCDGMVDEGNPQGCSCNQSDLILDWPLEGQDGQDWVVVNYVDHDPSNGILDYQNGQKSINGHNGIDIAVPSFREMDGPNFTYVRAAASGQIIEIVDEHEDRHYSCVDHNNNFITIEHANGYQTTYYHHKQNSSMVNVGQFVEAGDPIATVGSSGCSTAAHLQFTVRDCDQQVVDPFQQNMWSNAPIYNTEFGVMDLFLKEGAFMGPNELKDPPPDIAVLNGDLLGIGLSTAGGDHSTSFEVRVYRPDGQLYGSQQKSYNRVHTMALWQFAWGIPSMTGQWQVDIVHNGTVLMSKTFIRQ